MNYTLLTNNNITDYGIIIGCGLIIGCTIFFLIKSNYTAVPSKNIQALTDENIQALTDEIIQAPTDENVQALTDEIIQDIVNENAVTVINNDNLDAILDSESDTDSSSDYDSTFDTDSIPDIDLDELDLFFMPFVDFNVCSLQELKYFEISSIFSRELAEKDVSDEELMDLICYFTEDELLTNSINDFIRLVISNM
jgi:hypothetical protein